MNARQKCKQLKRLNERLREERDKKPVPYILQREETVRLAVSWQCYNSILPPINHVSKILSDAMGQEIMKYAKIHVEEMPGTIGNMMRYTAEVKVVKRHED